MTTTQQGRCLCESPGRVLWPAQQQAVRFCLSCPARQVYLLLSDEDGGAKALVRMDELRAGRWGLTLRLKPGTYRYRYYAYERGVTTYLSPCDGADTQRVMSGLDALLRVPADSARSRIGSHAPSRQEWFRQGQGS